MTINLNLIASIFLTVCASNALSMEEGSFEHGRRWEYEPLLNQDEPLVSYDKKVYRNRFTACVSNKHPDQQCLIQCQKTHERFDVVNAYTKRHVGCPNKQPLGCFCDLTRKNGGNDHEYHY